MAGGDDDEATAVWGLSGVSAARAGIMAAEVINELSERLSAAEVALERSTAANKLLEEELQAATARDEEIRRELGAACARLTQAQELCARALADADAHAARAQQAEVRASQADERAAQAHRAADAAVEASRADAAQAHAAQQHTEALLQRLASVASGLAARCALLAEQQLAAPKQAAPVVQPARRAPAAPLSLSVLNTVLRAAESELSSLDERLSERLGDNEEEAALRAAMVRTGARIRKIAAIRAALLGRSSSRGVGRRAADAC